MLSAPGDSLSETVTIPGLKLHSLEISQTFTGGTITIKKNNCLELRYFLSKTNDVVLSQRDGIGGFFEIRFQNEQHDYWKTKAKLDQSTVADGSIVDITKDLSHLRGRFGVETKNYLYLFCPFIKVGAEDADFELQIDLNKNPVELEDKSVLENEVFAINQGKEVSEEQSVKSPQDKIKDIINEVKGDGVSLGVKERMENAVSKYYEVSLHEIDVSLGGENDNDVKKVFRFDLIIYVDWIT
jgi:hypothetical protein